MATWDRREWSDVYGEPLISRAQLDAEVAAAKAQRSQYFQLRLTGDQITWLLEKLTLAAEQENRKDASSGEAVEIRDFQLDVLEQIYEQGYRV